MTRSLRKLWCDTRGVMLPYVTIMLVVIVGLATLGVDGARYVSLHSQMQAAADALALAGAAELNGKTGAQTRATTAMANFFQNYTSGMGTTAAIGYATPVFLSALPAADQLPSTGTVATSDANAHYVLVTVTPVTVGTIFPVKFLIPSASNNFAAGAQAVGGMTQAICDIPPVYICNPWEGTKTSLTTALASQTTRRTSLRILNDGTNSPGHFGWLVPPDGDASANNLRDWVGRTVPKTCYPDSSVNLNTGAKQSALDGLNMRFDIGADATHAPDVNVRKGYEKGTGKAPYCSASPSADITSVKPPAKSMALPEDDCFSAGTCPQTYLGNSQWDCATYWSWEHGPGVAVPTQNEFGEARTCGGPSTTTFSRYEIYKVEITAPHLTNWSKGDGSAKALYTEAGGGENGQPLCAASQGVTAVPGRRVLPVAVINCTANSAAMGNGSNNGNVPVEGFAKFFMIRRIPTTGAAGSRHLTGEFTGELTSIDAKIHTNVKLYR